MNQGFFVQVTSGNSSGTLRYSRDVCVHNTVAYLKTTNTVDSLIRLNLFQEGKNDETVIRFLADATVSFDGRFDANKLIINSDSLPQIYSITGGKMSINSLPAVQEVRLEVLGINNQNMTISATEINSFKDVYLRDNLEGIVINLSEHDYTFNYNNSFEERFKLFFVPLGKPEMVETPDFSTFSPEKDLISIRLYDDASSEIDVSNLLGQIVFRGIAKRKQFDVKVNNGGYYFVTVKTVNGTKTKKVFVN